MVKITGLLLAAVSALTIAGCGAGAGGQQLETVTVKLHDGGTVECVSQEHGLDCNWGSK